jgi:anti-sigma28 factor (negative regulator of flagellin synthesis)
MNLPSWLIAQLSFWQFDESSHLARGAATGSAPAPLPSAQNSPDDAVRARKLATIAAAVVDGSYYVRSAQIADKLIEYILRRGG